MTDAVKADKCPALVEHFMAMREEFNDPAIDAARRSVLGTAMERVSAFVLEHGTVEQVVKLYVARRDDKDAAKERYNREIEAVDSFLDRAEGRLRVAMQAEGVSSVRTAAGTAFRKTVTSATVGEKEDFKQFVQTNDDGWSFLDVKANKTAVAAYMEANGGALPPGIKWREEEVVQVRR